MRVEVRHFLPGRIRLFIPNLFRIEDDPEQLLHYLAAPHGIDKIRVNAHCATVVIEFDHNRPETIRDLLRTLRNGSGIAHLASLNGHGNGSAPAKPKSEVKQWQLALPTVSLALSFAASPAVAAVNAPLLLWNSRPIVARAWKVLSHEKRLNVDFLDCVAITVSMGQAHFATAGIVVWLIRLGDWIRDLTAARSKRAVSDLLEFQAKMTWVLRDGVVVATPVASVLEGDTVVIHSGEIVPVDGEVLTGHASIDQKTITGEGLPVNRSEGEVVYAGTSLREGYITVKATRVGGDTTAAQIVKLVESAPIGETRMQNHAERFADRLVVPTLGLATGMSLITGDVNRFTSIVIVDYGTGIRVAAPTSVLASMTHAARQGILIKSGAHLEKLAEVDTIVFDKTGTLTSGTPHVLNAICYNEKHFSSRLLLGLAAAAEARLQHPVAEAIRVRTTEDKIEVPECQEVQYRVGYGVEARIDGFYLHLGSERFLRRESIDTSMALRDQRELNEQGCSSLMLAIDGKVAGLIPYADKVRPESHDVIQRLHNLGVRNTIMLTGDNGTVAKAVSGRLGLSRFMADMLPSQKSDYVQALRAKGQIVAMVGDGINDSPALSFADVGIAMKHGAQVAHESANIVLLEDSLWKLVQAIEISRDGVALIKQNYAIVAVLNTLALALALPGGLISPQTTAILSNGSAIVASLNAIRPTLRY
jgi:Cu2+-exporting ATPase